MEFCLVGSRPIDPKQRIRIFKHRDKTEVSKILRKSDGFSVFRQGVLNVCLAKAKHLVLNVGKCCFNLYREANYCPKGAFADRAEEIISMVLFAFLSIFSLGFLLLFIAQ